MLISSDNNTVTFSIFSKFSELLCVFSKRQWGDLSIGKRPIDLAKKFLDNYSIISDQLAVTRQRHTNEVEVVKKKNNPQIIQNKDALLTNEEGLFLGIIVADCVPLFFYDPVKKIVAAVHAGWQGTLGSIATNVITAMIKLESRAENIYVAIGPHIGGCCYSVSQERASLFLEKFNDQTIAFKNQQKWYLDLGKSNFVELVNNGVLASHIDSPPSCTSCQNDQFFSFRKDKLETFGEMLGIIGMRKV